MAEVPVVWTEANEKELRERLQAITNDQPEEDHVEWTPSMESELRSLLRKTAEETRDSLRFTPFLKDIESRAGFTRRPAPDGVDMEARIDFWESWLIRKLPESLLGPFLKCCGIVPANIRSAKGKRKYNPKTHL